MELVHVVAGCGLSVALVVAANELGLFDTDTQAASDELNGEAARAADAIPTGDHWS